MSLKLFIILIFVIKCVLSDGGNRTHIETVTSLNEAVEEVNLEMYRLKFEKSTQEMEKRLKDLIKSAVKGILPSLMSYSTESLLSTKCMGGFMKYISGLTSTKVWALKMFDATSKPPSGILEGTFSDFGSFDMCLEIEVPSRKGDIEFRGKYCAVEFRPVMPPIPRNFSMSKQKYAGPMDSISRQFMLEGSVFHYLKFRFGICLPSLCSLEEIQNLAKQVGSLNEMDIKVPQCYVQEDGVFKPIHIAVIFILGLLFLLSVAGSIVEHRSKNTSEGLDTKLSLTQQIIICFSIVSNYRRLFSSSKGSKELKALQGIRALSMAWVLLGHTYVWTNFQLKRRPGFSVGAFNKIAFGCIMNGWMSVETFFFLSGLLTCYAVMKILPKTKGKINIPIFVLRRYVRLTPPLLLVMGTAFFLPLISSGPFWYEMVEPEIKSCTNNWWYSILYISNWIGMKSICVHPTWYLSADFQLYVVSSLFLYLLYRSPKLGLSFIAAFVIASTAVVATLTTLWDLPPIILIASGNDRQIEQTVDIVHMNTLAHAGPYFVGIVVGYLLTKYKDIKMSKTFCSSMWIFSTFTALTSLYGAHQWNIGEPHGPLLTAIYASLHRTTFTVAVGWITYACTTGHGGIVNSMLSSTLFAPVSRLTFMIYLMHPLVLWLRVGSLRERQFLNHYNIIYDYVGNVAATVLISIPFYLLLEAPLSNLERMVFSKASNPTAREEEAHQPSGNLHSNILLPPGQVCKAKPSDATTTVSLMSIKTIENGLDNLVFRDDLLNTRSNLPSRS